MSGPFFIDGPWVESGALGRLHRLALGGRVFRSESDTTDRNAKEHTETVACQPGETVYARTEDMMLSLYETPGRTCDHHTRDLSLPRISSREISVAHRVAPFSFSQIWHLSR